MESHKILELEAKACFDFFWSSENTNTDINSKGYGLVVDRTNKKDHSSLAAVGFALTSYVIGVERGWITFDQAYERVKGTLKTLYYHVPHYKGFFVHYAYMDSAERYKKCEYSTIDTGLLLNGVLTVDSYFDCDEIHELTKNIYDRIDWNHFIFLHHGKTTFRMAYNPDKDGDYVNEEAGFIHYWDMPAEQLMLYFLASGSDTVSDEVAIKLYEGFNRYAGGYKNHQFIFTPGGALFIYQFSHAWFDFRKYVDVHGFDWFQNSVNATMVNRLWCIDHQHMYKTFNEHSWGLTACDSPTGYAAFGPEPLGWYEINHNKHRTNGTVAPNACCGSLPFAPKECIAALNYMYHNHPQLWGEFGFKDSYNLEGEPWYCDNYLGIDKGISLLGIDNYLHGTTWHYYMKHDIIKKAIKKLRFKEKNF